MAFTSNLMGRASDELLSRMGLRPRPSMLGRFLPAGGFFAGGVIVGIGIGVLFAPRSGADTRAAIWRGITKARARAKKVYAGMIRRADESVEAASEATQSSPTARHPEAPPAGDHRAAGDDRRGTAQASSGSSPGGIAAGASRVVGSAGHGSERSGARNGKAKGARNGKPKGPHGDKSLARHQRPER